MRRSVCALFVSVACMLLQVNNTHAFYTNMPADVVIGQPTFTTNVANQGGTAGANTISGPEGGIATDGNFLAIVDQSNSRVLIYNKIPSANNAAADVVVGQTSFAGSSANQGGSAGANTLSAPRGICTNGSRLLIVDNANNRVLVFNTIPKVNNASADVVIGQSDFSGTSFNQGGTTTGLRAPRGCFVDRNGKLYITDTMNHRVLIYNSIPVTNAATPDVVVGQTDLTTGTNNQGGIGANTLGTPAGVYSDGTKLIIADQGNQRVLIYNSIPTSNKPSADVVVGQAGFSSNGLNQGGNPSANTLSSPRGVWVSNGRLFVGDQSNNRVLVFNSVPTANNASADLVIGQSSFTTNSANQGGSVAANTLGSPSSNSVLVVNDTLFVTDVSNNRILMYKNVISAPKMSFGGITEGSDGKLIATGSIKLGERTRYGLWKVEASVNAEGYGSVSHIDGGRDDGADTLYDFYHEFVPWANNGTKETWMNRGYTVKLKAANYNADEDYMFYFMPFTLTGVTRTNSLNLTALVNSTQWQHIKNNLDSFEVWVKQSDTWIIYADKITPPQEVTNGRITFSVQPKDGVLLSPGTYDVKIVAKDKWGHRQDSNNKSVTFESLTVGNVTTQSTQWFPVQINTMSGVSAGILSSFSALEKTKSYVANHGSTLIRGIAFSGSTVTINVVDLDTLKSRVYRTGATNSRWEQSVSLYARSLVTVEARSAEGYLSSIAPFVVRR